MKTACDSLKQLIVIAGPTASGKTSLSIQLAKELGAEIFNADSRQFYRKLDIGTAKPSQSELKEVRHHFIDIKEPDEYYSAGEFEKDVITQLDTYFQSKEIAIMVGGSGLYIKAVLEGFDNLPKDDNLRIKLNERIKHEGLEALQSEVRKLDASFAETMDFKNPQRVARALEVMQLTSRPYSELRTNSARKRNFETHAFYLNPNREFLYQKINERVDLMIAKGLESEVNSLNDFRICNALQTVGYKELFEYLDGNYTRDEAIEKIKQHTRNYAKRQITWFKKQNGFIEIVEEAYSAILKHLNKTLSV
ncbi:tRNA (adenosine(37)-N6)-dimethylallyltransferase MiaA [bacterium]|nr:tRNA (adenosine(37)-N6)-dimethylallyltransferase MiaA [bacterium]